MLLRLCNEFIFAAEKSCNWSRDREITCGTCQEMHKLLKIIRQILPKYFLKDKNSHVLISNEQAISIVFDCFMRKRNSKGDKFEHAIKVALRDLLDEYNVQYAESVVSDVS